LSSNVLPSNEIEATDRLVEVVDLFENANVGLMLTDRAGTVLRANGAQRRLVAWPSSGSSPGLPARALFPDAAWELMTTTSAAGHALHNLAVTIRRADGSAQDALLDVNGEPDGDLLRIVTRPRLQAAVPGPQDADAGEWHMQWGQADIAAPAELPHNEMSAITQELDDFFEHLPVAIHQVPPTGLTSRANRAQLRMLGCAEDPEKFLGQLPIPFFPVEADLAVMADGLFNWGAIVNYPTTMRRLDGSDVPVVVYSSSRVVDGDWRSTRCFCFYANASDAPDSPADGTLGVVAAPSRL